MQCLQVGRHSRRQRIKGNIFAAVGPLDITCYSKKYFIRVHHVGYRTSLYGLAGSVKARPAILVGAIHPAWHLAVNIHHGMVIALGGCQVCRVL